ncbi:hypothetical protein AB4097_10055 [Microvirga sp. 2MCAF35]|uniref:hypothetical protein n=1 Tax=Microvirga sp. 2MCAF35 TaxID=3232987 RepID=UPI003F9900AA
MPPLKPGDKAPVMGTELGRGSIIASSWPTSLQKGTWLYLVATTAIVLTVTGCTLTSNDGPSSAVAVAPAAFGRERLIGRWGTASFHTEKDRQRTEREARAQCSQPYRIAEGPTDGVMMHVADDPTLYELRLKGDAAGKTYLGFEAPPGHPQDREILTATDNLMIMRFIDPDANRRYGTFVYVRCGA